MYHTVAFVAHDVRLSRRRTRKYEYELAAIQIFSA
jgi:hypothetical protein